MALSLPPLSAIRCDADTAQYVHDELTSVIAGHPQATTTYRFYEELDEWLGPWGERGYPIAYGKLYNVAFSNNKNLMANQTTKQWVWRTTIFLQEALRDFVVSKIKDKTIPSLSEAQLRKAAFDSHPKAYDRGGLTTVILAAPELIPVIATIPSAEFLPTSSNFIPTIQQVFTTIGLVGPKVVGGGLAVAAGPAHTGAIRNAVQRDRAKLMNELAMSKELGKLQNLIKQGKLDHIPWLEQIVAQLNAKQFPNQGFARFAGEVIKTAQERKKYLSTHYKKLFNQSPEVRARVQKIFSTSMLSASN